MTDQGIRELNQFKRLKRLDLKDTRVTEEGIKKLHAALLNCGIRKPKKK